MDNDEAALRRTIIAARFVADHWRVAALGWAEVDASVKASVAHPLCCVLAALDGETDPAMLGVAEEEYDAFRAAVGA